LNNQDYVLVETEYVGLYMWVETVNGWDYICGWRLNDQDYVLVETIRVGGDCVKGWDYMCGWSL